MIWLATVQVESKKYYTEMTSISIYPNPNVLDSWWERYSTKFKQLSSEQQEAIGKLIWFVFNYYSSPNMTSTSVPFQIKTSFPSESLGQFFQLFEAIDLFSRLLKTTPFQNMSQVLIHDFKSSHSSSVPIPTTVPPATPASSFTDAERQKLEDFTAIQQLQNSEEKIEDLLKAQSGENIDMDTDSLQRQIDDLEKQYKTQKIELLNSNEKANQLKESLQSSQSFLKICEMGITQSNTLERTNKTQTETIENLEAEKSDLEQKLEESERHVTDLLEEKTSLEKQHPVKEVRSWLVDYFKSMVEDMHDVIFELINVKTQLKAKWDKALTESKFDRDGKSDSNWKALSLEEKSDFVTRGKPEEWNSDYYENYIQFFKNFIPNIVEAIQAHNQVLKSKNNYINDISQLLEDAETEIDDLKEKNVRLQKQSDELTAFKVQYKEELKKLEELCDEQLTKNSKEIDTLQRRLSNRDGQEFKFKMIQGKNEKTEEKNKELEFQIHILEFQKEKDKIELDAKEKKVDDLNERLRSMQREYDKIEENRDLISTYLQKFEQWVNEKKNDRENHPDLSGILESVWTRFLQVIEEFLNKQVRYEQQNEVLTTQLKNEKQQLQQKIEQLRLINPNGKVAMEKNTQAQQQPRPKKKKPIPEALLSIATLDTRLPVHNTVNSDSFSSSSDSEESTTKAGTTDISAWERESYLQTCTVRQTKSRFRT